MSRVCIAWHDERGLLLAEVEEIVADGQAKVAIPLDAAYCRIWEQRDDC